MMTQQHHVHFRHLVGLLLLLPANTSLAEPASNSDSADRPPDSGNASQEVITIPLDQIWAYQMPGTRDILDLEPEQRQEHLQSMPPDQYRRMPAKGLWIPIALSLCDTSPHWPREGQRARPSFAVVGEGLDALREAHAVLVKGNRPRTVFSPSDNISLVFFSYQMGSRVELRKVTRRGDLIDVRYRLISPLQTRSLSAHLTLIPLGQLPRGDFRVNVIQEPTGQEMLDGSYAAKQLEPRDKRMERETGSQFISGSFTFKVN